MLKAILFDLDDTLLGNDINQFTPPYFQLLGRYAARYMDIPLFSAALKKAVEELAANTDPATTNRDVFWAEFGQHVDLDTDYLEGRVFPFL